MQGVSHGLGGCVASGSREGDSTGRMPTILVVGDIALLLDDSASSCAICDV